MSMDTWASLINIVRIVSPLCRLELGMAGEPTLHPRLLDMFRYARKECPSLQLMMYTNGTTIISGKVTYRELFNAGLNMVFVDMYSPGKKHMELAEASGYIWFEQGKRPENIPNIFTYHNNPDLHLIQLSRQPGDWTKRKVSSGKFSTYFNHLDWPAAEPYGLSPVVKPPARRCDLPSKFPSVCWDGSWSFCCFDFMREVAGTLGNVSEGVNGFFRFWIGKYIQDVRRKLYLKDRAGHTMCSRCAFTSIRCDIPWWPPELLDNWWDGNQWESFNDVIAEIESKRIKSIGLGLPSPKIRKVRRKSI
jgi:hypothetical protein